MAATRSGPKHKKPATKKTVTYQSKDLSLPKKLLPKKSAAKITPLKTGQAGQRTYRGQATLGEKKVRSSPTFQKVIVDGQSYVLVPEHEHGTADTEKADALIERLREIRNDLFDDGNRAFNLAGRQIGIAIALLREGGVEEEGNNECNECGGS